MTPERASQKRSLQGYFSTVCRMLLSSSGGGSDGGGVRVRWLE